MTDAVTRVDGVGVADGCQSDTSIRRVLNAPDGAAGTDHLSSRTIAEALRTAATLPAPDGARLIMELTVAGGPWNSASVARQLPHGMWGTWVATGPLGQLGDPLQWELGEGPARDALTAELVTAPDLPADRRWPAWRAAALPLGGRAVVAIRLHAGRTLGLLTVYADRPVVPDRAAVDHLQTMAAHLSALLDVTSRVRNLEEAMRSRGVIGQAIGLLVERYGIAAEQAFATLRRISQNENVKIAHLATRLVETGDLPGLHPRGG